MQKSLVEFKKQFFQSADRVPLNNAGLAPIPAQTRDCLKYWADRYYTDGFLCDADYMAAVQTTRERLAELLLCSAEDIAFFQNVSNAISQLVFQLPLQKGREVLMWDQEYTSVLYPVREACERQGLHLKVIASDLNLPLPADQFLAAINNDTALVVVSWAQFQTGARMDLATLLARAQAVGAFVLVDAMQGLGVIPWETPFDQIDGIVGGNHKWLCAPVGLGFMALNKKWQNRLRPHNVGSGTFGTCDDPADFVCAPKRDATRFESGAKQVLEIVGLGESLRLIQDVGVSVIAQEAERLATLLAGQLQQAGFEVRSQCLNNLDGLMHPIVNFTAPEDLLGKVALALKHHQITFALRGGGIRLSPHAFNTDEQIAHVLGVIAAG